MKVLNGASSKFGDVQLFIFFRGCQPFTKNSSHCCLLEIKLLVLFVTYFSNKSLIKYSVTTKHFTIMTKQG